MGLEQLDRLPRYPRRLVPINCSLRTATSPKTSEVLGIVRAHEIFGSLRLRDRPADGRPARGSGRARALRAALHRPRHHDGRRSQRRFLASAPTRPTMVSSRACANRAVAAYASRSTPPTASRKGAIASSAASPPPTAAIARSRPIPSRGSGTRCCCRRFASTRPGLRYMPATCSTSRR